MSKKSTKAAKNTKQAKTAAPAKPNTGTRTAKVGGRGHGLPVKKALPSDAELARAMKAV